MMAYKFLPRGRTIYMFFVRYPLLTVIFVVFCFSHAFASMQISELMASNTSTLNDQDGDSSDWIELYNNGSSSVDLAGWYLTDDASDLMQWTFPAVTVPAGGYLLVFASKKDLRTGELHANFSLKGSGEYLALVMPDGSTIAHGFSYPPQVSDISYGLSSEKVTSTVLPQGATGQADFINGVEVARDSAPASPTWDAEGESRDDNLNEEWTTFSVDLTQVTLNAGENLLAIHGMNTRVESSDMLILPELDVVTPSNSTDWLYYTAPTPGSENMAGNTNLPPQVSGVTQTLAVLPVGGAGSLPILVEARVDKTMHDVATVRLYYRKMFEGESSLLMVDDGTNGDLFSGDGIYSAWVPTTSLSAGEMMRWRVLATDTEGNAMRAPMYEDSNDSDEYYGAIAQDPAIASSNLPVLHWFVENLSAANTRSGTRASYYYLGEFYDNIQVDLHGQTTGDFSKKSYDIDFNKGNRFKWKEGGGRVKDINLLTNWADKTKMRNTLSYEMFKNAGAAHHFAFPVRVQKNGDFFSVADMVEDGDDRFLERIGLDGDGALYKMYNKLTGPGRKKTRFYEGTTDIQTLVSSLNESLSQNKRRLYGYDHVDIPATVNYLAGLVLAGSQDQGYKNYYVYRDSNGTGEWMPIVWDVDLSLGHDWGGGKGILMMI